MSLKPFHIVLISSGIALAIGLAFWALKQYAVSHRAADLGTAAGSVAVAGVLAVYLFWFLKKMKEKGW